jgi:hypothetical protein
MKDFLFFAAVYGAAASLALFKVGASWRLIGTWIDQRLFPRYWAPAIPPEQRGGPVRGFVHCPVCISFWVAVLFSLEVHSPSKIHLEAVFPWSLVIDGLASAGIIWCVHVALTRLGQYDL